MTAPQPRRQRRQQRLEADRRRLEVVLAELARLEEALVPIEAAWRAAPTDPLTKVPYRRALDDLKAAYQRARSLQRRVEGR